ncbi:MAG: hypothetical protein H6739_17740 [Alphaproteobacteria bacterium]|nr:hypothetical protein [Alphaproteobacteria bacterium]
MIALWMLGITGAWAQETCQEIYEQTCGGAAQPTHTSVSLEDRLTDCMLQTSSETCCWHVDNAAGALSPQANALSDITDTQERDLVLFFGDGGAIDAITLDSTTDLCSGSGPKCYVRSLTLCPLPGASPSPQSTAVNVANLLQTGDGTGFVARELQFDGGSLSVTRSDVVLSDLALRDTPVSIDDNTEASAPIELTRLMSCGVGSGLLVQGLSDTRYPAAVRASLFAGTGAHLLEVGGASQVTLENNHLIGATSGALDVPGTAQITGSNNLFLYTSGVLSPTSSSPFERWSRNSGWQVTLTEHLDETLLPTAAPFAYNDTLADCYSGALADLFDAWPDALGSRDLIPTEDSPLVVTGTLAQQGPDTGQPLGCNVDIGAFGGPYALPAMWAENNHDDGDHDCLEPGRDCDDGTSRYLNVYADQDGDGFVSTGLACLTPSDSEQASPGDDCDDSDLAINPEADDDDCDDVDDDCDGTPDQNGVCDAGDDSSALDDTGHMRDTGVAPSGTSCSALWLKTPFHFAALLLAPLLGWGLSRKRRPGDPPEQLDRG